jgi:hypothetical protein
MRDHSQCLVDVITQSRTVHSQYASNSNLIWTCRRPPNHKMPAPTQQQKCAGGTGAGGAAVEGYAAGAEMGCMYSNRCSCSDHSFSHGNLVVAPRAQPAFPARLR